MAKKKPSTKTAKRAKASNKERRQKKLDMQAEVQGTLLFALGLFLFVCIIIPDSAVIPRLIAPFLFGLFGIFAYPFTVFVMAAGAMRIFARKLTIEPHKILLFFLFLFCLSGTLHFFLSGSMKAGSWGNSMGNAYLEGQQLKGFGLLASFFVYPVYLLLGSFGTPTLFIAGAIVVAIVLFNLSLRKTGQKVAEKTVAFSDKVFVPLLKRDPPPAFNEELTDFDEPVRKGRRKDREEPAPVPPPAVEDPIVSRGIKVTGVTNDVSLFSEMPPAEPKPQPAEVLQESAQQLEPFSAPAETDRKYQIPPIHLLKKPAFQRGNDKTDHSENVLKLEGALRSFGINAKVENICVGPAVSRYELTIEQGTRVNRILALSDDIALAMAARGVRIEAPIPGKSAIGIEIPNDSVTPVSLREVIDTPEFQNSESCVSMAVGKDITGKPAIADISKMPHLLIAGQTGSGKSVAINSLIISLLYKATPEEVKFILVDPKKVELSVYNGLPNLVLPVVTDPKKAAGALLYVVKEMENRYDLFDQNRVKDIGRYNEQAKEKGHPTLPRIVVIVDELNDLMMVAPGDVEDSVMRIAQLARAAGIYLVLATQRPSVNVITGVIKANIPSRMAFAVASGHDSRTILDMVGAEKLVGRGDMLFHRNGDPKPIRVQGAYIDEADVEKVVSFIRENASAPQYIDEANIALPEKGKLKSGPDLEGEEDADELLHRAIETVLDNEQASISLLQRKLGVGYARAGRLIDSMETKKIVGPSQGSKPRELLINKEQYINLFRKNENE